MTRILRIPHFGRRASLASIVAATVVAGCGVIRIERNPDAPSSKRPRSAVCLPPLLPSLVFLPLPTSADSIPAWAAENAARSAAANSEAAQLMAAYHRCLAFGDTLS